MNLINSLDLEFFSLKSYNDMTGKILSNTKEIGVMKITLGDDFLYVHSLEIFVDYRGKKLLPHIVSLIQEEFPNRSIMFHVLNIDNETKKDTKLYSYYKSLGYKTLENNLMEITV